jgi:glycosyltransferase involved in cell wall biosynthesis
VRILYAHCFYRIPGGEDRHVRDQVDLVSAAHDVELISEENSGLAETPATAARMLYSRAKKRDVRAMIDRFAPDVVHIHNMYPALGPAVVLAARESGVPVVMTVHNFRLRCPNGFMFTEGAMCRRCESGVYINAVLHRCFPKRKQAAAYAAILWGHRFLLRLETQIARFIVPSAFMRERLLDGGIASDRISLIRHFVKRAEDVSNAKVGPYGAFVGRLSPEKGLDVLLAALRRAGDPPFLIIGDGQQRQRLEDLARSLRLANTRFLGWRPSDQVRELVAEARYVAIPSLGEETAGLGALEGLSAGRPLLVSDRGALPELVADGAGVVCRPGDEVDMSEKISRLTKDDELCHRAASAATLFARRWLDPGLHLASLESVYREVSP